MARGCGGGFSGSVTATGSSSGADGGDGDVLDHREANRGGAAATASIPCGVVTTPATGVDRRQEGGRGRDANGGGSEKGHGGDSSAFY
jgi:hypothetical protein